MTSMPREMSVFESYMDDIEKQVEQIYDESRYEAEKTAERLLKGDFALAAEQLVKAESTGYDTRKARVRLLMAQAELAHNVIQVYYQKRACQGSGTFADAVNTIDNLGRICGDIPGKDWAKRAIDWLMESISIYPTQIGYWRLGNFYIHLRRKQEAINAWRNAESGDDTEISVAAIKAIARLEQGKKACYIATACYGSHDHPDVLLLRSYRDEVMLHSTLGRWFMRLYYLVSPKLACCVGRSQWLSSGIRSCLLQPFIERIRRQKGGSE